MTDSELTQHCAAALGAPIHEMQGERVYICHDPENHAAGFMHRIEYYAPLDDDAQAMALDTFLLESGYSIHMTSGSCDILPLDANKPSFHWFNLGINSDMTKAENRRRIRVDAVAHIQAAKVTA